MLQRTPGRPEQEHLREASRIKYMAENKIADARVWPAFKMPPMDPPPGIQIPCSPSVIILEMLVVSIMQTG